MKNKKTSRRIFIASVLSLLAGVYEGSRITFKLAGQVELSLRDIQRQPDPNKKAILVYSNKLFKDNIEIMDHLLRSYGYQCHTIGPQSANKENIFDTSEEVAGRSNTDYQTVLYFSGDGIKLGSRIGLDVNGPDLDERVLTPQELFKSLHNIQGKKAIILDACLSGTFVDYLEDNNPQESSYGIDDYVVIAACPSDKDTVGSKMFIAGKYVGALTMGLYNVLNFAEGPIDLSTVEIPSPNAVYRRAEKVHEFIRPKNGQSEVSFKIQRTSDTDFIL